MTREEIIRMARKAGFSVLSPSEHIGGVGAVYAADENITDELERFAALVAAAEREACAKVCDSWSKRPDDVGGYCAAEIRARGQELVELVPSNIMSSHVKVK